MCDHDINEDLISFLFSLVVYVCMYVYVALSQLVYSFYIEKRDRTVVNAYE